MLCWVDLAGSEHIVHDDSRRRKRSGRKGEHLDAERKAIIASRLAVRRVLLKLHDSHVPFADDILTKNLKSSLRPQAKVLLLSTISTLHQDLAGTLDTLQFADQVRSRLSPNERGGRVPAV